MATDNVRPYVAAIDEDAALALYEEVCGGPWPLSRDSFSSIVIYQGFKPGDALLVESAGSLRGFVASQLSSAGTGSITLLLFRDEATGVALLHAAGAHLRRRGATAIQLGAGGETYFWPGVPDNLPGLAAFYREHGWSFSHTSVDLVRELGDYVTPPEVWQRVEQRNYRFAVARAADIERLLAFEAEQFPQWFSFFSRKAAAGDLTDLLFVADDRGEVVASVLLDSAASSAKGQYWTWRSLLGERAGAFGALGVRPEARRQGIGLALAARATELLQERGVRNCWVGWTWLVDWYGKLGYRIWRTYQMSRKELEP